jgi:hypothetical protein
MTAAAFDLRSVRQPLADNTFQGACRTFAIVNAKRNAV